MCGLTGWLAREKTNDGENVALRMAEAIRHRGPDDSGLWQDRDQGLMLAHRRLSILDLSAAGHQPMHAHDGRYVLVFNGEIYNHLELRRRLEDAREADD